MCNKIYIITLVMGLFIGCGGGSGPTSTNADTPSFDKPTDDEILAAINEVRSQEIDCNDGLGVVGPSQPLSWNSELYAAAEEHSDDLAMSDTFSHDGSGTEYDIAGYNRGKKSYFTERIDDHGYQDYDIVGENIAGGFDDLAMVIDGWIKSPDHCANLMREDFDEVGTAVVVNPDSTYGIYWTQDFGHREAK